MIAPGHTTPKEPAEVQFRVSWCSKHGTPDELESDGLRYDQLPLWPPAPEAPPLQHTVTTIPPQA
jgi:hypothetical protein